MEEMDVYCLDVGAHSVKVVVLLKSGEIKIRRDLKVRSIVDVDVSENNEEEEIVTNKDFIAIINKPLETILKSSTPASNVTTDNGNYLKTKDTDLYFDELLALLFEKIRARDANVRKIITNLEKSETLHCAAILSGLSIEQSVQAHISIISAFFDVKKRILAIDLGYSELRLYKINNQKGEKEFYPLSSHEFTLALFNFAMDKRLCDARELLEECEVAKAKLSGHEFYNFQVNSVCVSRSDFEKCAKPVVQRLVSKLREFLNGDLGWDGDVVLIGSSFEMPVVSRAVKRALKRASFVDVDPGYVIAYGMAMHFKMMSGK